MLNLLSIGDIKLDTFVVVPETSSFCKLQMPEYLLCFNYGEKIPVGAVESQIAGSAPNVAVGLSRLGFKTSVFSFMGQDGIHKLALDVLKKEKVDARLIKTLTGAKSSFSAVLNYKGEKTILASHISYPYALPKRLPQMEWMYVCEMGHNYKRLYREAARCAKNRPLKIGFNPGAIQIMERDKALYELIAQTEVLFVNVGEAHAILKQERQPLPIERVASELYKMGPKIIVITDGRKGAYAFDGNQLDFCPVFPSKRVEATGAGDAFATGYLGALMRKIGHREALRWGAANGASVVGFVGPQPGLLTLPQMRATLRKHANIKAVKR
ncbi:carbohydrate kinase family protein [Candidatus Uhrbacteria bacterium]|nr:carbohydrate kinase family protein [Candidatus Uhrbacteria bacterium]